MSNKDAAISVKNVSKTFKLPHEKNTSLKGALLNTFKNKGFERQEALKDISFDVKKGEFFGVVGRNGSGKSTLLKTIAGIYVPDSGSIKINGTLTPFIELGVGFNPELTGRENVFLNGALLGIDRKKMSEIYDEIVGFAELEKFMDQKLKNYSSGMQVRLAFSIAIRAKSDILLLDEVIAVGDAAFQKKCIDVFEKYKAGNKTIILVTHNMDIVEKFCTRAILLEEGKIQKMGQPEDISYEYTKVNFDITKDELIRNSRVQSKSNIRLKIKGYDAKRATYKCNDKLNIEISWPKNIKGVENAAIAIFKNSGEFIFGSNTLGSNKPIKNSANYEVTLSLGPGNYHLVARLFGETKDDIVDRLNDGPEFIVVEDMNGKAPKGQQNGLVRLDNKWSI